MINFAFKKGYTDKETKTIALESITHQTCTYSYFNNSLEIPNTYVPVGDIKWVQSIIGKIKPDYYPNFLKSLLHRNVWESNEWPLEKNVFVKPSDIPKRFLPIITSGTYNGKKKPPYWCSDLVHFIDEFRYYVINGEIVYSSWYLGNNENRVVPEFPLEIPKNYCGAIDLGFLSTGELALIEAGEPYSIGWYGHLSEGSIYVKFLSKGYEYLQNLNGIIEKNE